MKDKTRIIQLVIVCLMGALIVYRRATGIVGFVSDKNAQSASQTASVKTTDDKKTDSKTSVKSSASDSKTTVKSSSDKKTADTTSPSPAADSAQAEAPGATETAPAETPAPEAVEAEEAEEVIADGQYPIIGKTGVTVEQMVAYFNSSDYEYPAEALGAGGAGDIQTFAQMYEEEAAAEGVRAEIAFVQAMKETGWLQFQGVSDISQYNFAGMGATGGDVQGGSFADVRTGIRAQIQHLKAYATAQALNQECVDDRYELVTKESAPYVEWLGQQENPEGYGWATDPGYGYSIVEMIQSLKSF